MPTFQYVLEQCTSDNVKGIFLFETKSNKFF